MCAGGGASTKSSDGTPTPGNDVQLKISYAGMLRVGIDFHFNPPRGRHPCEVCAMVNFI
jgi:hypothetical protein